jgi:hypothetical protein
MNTIPKYALVNAPMCCYCASVVLHTTRKESPSSTDVQKHVGALTRVYFGIEFIEGSASVFNRNYRSTFLRKYNTLSSKEILHLMWNPEVGYNVNNRPSVDPIFSHMNQFHSLLLYFIVIHFISIYLSTPRSSKCLLSFRIYAKTFPCTSLYSLFFKFWFVRLLALRPLLAYCASLG